MDKVENKDEVIKKAIKMCYELIDKYDNNRDITDIDLCEVIEALRGRDHETIRYCYECGEENFDSGYVINDGDEYFCSDKCLYANYSEKSYLKMYEDGTAYWTQWDE